MPPHPPVIVPLLNEGLSLPGCLESLRDFSDVSVVDSGSTGATREITARLGRQVVDFAWDGRFPKKRNWALEHCEARHDWILFLDADERVTPAFVDELRHVLPESRRSGFCRAETPRVRRVRADPERGGPAAV
jgi:glycosyltransferase involved in cell wall biosynthesis